MRIAELSFPVDAELADQRCEDGLGDRGEVVERGHAVAVDAVFDPDGDVRRDVSAGTRRRRM
jgi:hypothetical protein